MVTSSQTTCTTCPYCGVGCGVLATVQDDASVSVAGDPDHPANFGRLCSKGSALAETLSLDDRLLEPMINGHNSQWNTALDLVADKFSKTISEHGPDSVAFYVSGQLLTEDYYVANKLMKGFIGSANIDTNSRVCMASSVAGHKRAFGTDTVPGCYEDLEQADVVVLAGSNLAWCHPVLYQRLATAKAQRGTKVVVIDPRRTATCDIADLHLSIAPGADVALFNGLLAHLDENDFANETYVENHTTGFHAALAEAQKYDLETIAKITGLSHQDIKTFYKLFAEHERTVSVYSQGINQSTSGTDKVNAIINCHLLTGRIGKPGMGPFSVTGQPNAMGGREVGGLANQLAGHMELNNPRHRDSLRAFWNAPAMAHKPGHLAVDLFRAVADGRIKALWIMATNPVDSLPQADEVRDAIDTCPFVVVSDVSKKTDTTACADVLLPATAWGEKDGTVTNSERRISRQRAFLSSPGNTKPDWWIITQVAKRMGYETGFDYRGPADIFDEYTRSTALENNGTRDFDISGLSGHDEQAYNNLKPTIWPVPATQTTAQTDPQAAPQTPTTTSRFFADGRFYTPDGKARFITTPYREPQTKVSPTYPLVLNTGRIRDQWHTMTRTGKSPRLMGHIGEPFVEVHPHDAASLELTPASLCEITSKHGTVIARTLITQHQRKGSVFAPMHWSDQYASRARIDTVVSNETDPVSGQPESKYTPVAIKPWPARWYGFAVLAQKPENLKVGYWALARSNAGWCLEMAHSQPCPDWNEFAQQLFNPSQPDQDINITPELLAYRDQAQGNFRFLAFNADKLHGALFISPQPVAVSRNWAAGLLVESFATPAEKLKILAARPGADQPDPGAIVCSCFSVGTNQIADAAKTKGCMSVDDIGATLGAGTNCGSCRPEIKKILGQVAKAS